MMNDAQQDAIQPSGADSASTQPTVASGSLTQAANGTAALPLATRARLPHVPRLSIGHFLFWTAVTAVVLGVLTQAFGATGSGAPVLAVLLLALAATVLGWLYSGALLIGWHAVRRTLWKLEPGEWLVLFLVNVLTVWGAFGLWEEYRWSPIHSHAVQVFLHLMGMEMYEFMNLIYKCIPGQFAAVLIAVIVSQRREKIWRALFLFAAILLLMIYVPIAAPDLVEDVFRGMSERTGMLFFCLVLSALLGLLMAGVARDRMNRVARHWLHWSGVGLVALSLLLVVGTMAAYLFRWYFRWYLSWP